MAEQELNAGAMFKPTSEQVWTDGNGNVYVCGENITTIRHALAATKLNGTLEAYQKGFKHGLQAAQDAIGRVELKLKK